MQRLGSASNQWVFYLTTVLLVAACVLRSILVYARDTPVLSVALAGLAAWSLLFFTEGEISRRWPVYFPVYLVLQTILGALLLSFPGYPDSYAILFLLLSMQVVQRRSVGAALLWMGLFIALIAIALMRAYGPVQGPANALIYAGGIALAASFAHAARRAQAGRAQNQALARELEEANRQLQLYAQQLERLAAARERQHLARDLHDSVTQTVFSMTLATQTALLLLERDPGRVGAQLDQLNRLAQSALSEMRVLVSKLDREPVAERGLAAALREHLLRPEMANLAVSIEIQGSQRLSPAEDQGLYRIAQEALNNVVKHARTDRAWVRLCLDEPPWMEIEDRGCGFDEEQAPERGGVGLAGMRERAAEIGWTLQVVTRPRAGTRIRVERVEKRSA